ncbi:hypothetical protein J3323_11185, partial [Leuconostoc mesenteroides]|nr:hypothetical protein [Leuconostoc mesenteroides]
NILKGYLSKENFDLKGKRKREKEGKREEVKEGRRRKKRRKSKVKNGYPKGYKVNQLCPNSQRLGLAGGVGRP